jgi:hypothetical protein
MNHEHNPLAPLSFSRDNVFDRLPGFKPSYAQDPNLAQCSITLKTGKTTTVEVTSANP